MSETILPGLFDPIDAIGEDTLTKLTNFCEQQLHLQKEIELLEEQLKEKKKEFEEISREQIPKLLLNTGLSELRLANGYKVVVKDQVRASITDKNFIQAYHNMIQYEGGDVFAEEKINSLFKSKVVIEQVNDDLLDMLLQKGVPYDNKKEIHYQTLQKYCRERLEQGLEIPEGISVYQYQESIIKK